MLGKSALLDRRFPFFPSQPFLLERQAMLNFATQVAF